MSWLVVLAGLTAHGYWLTATGIASVLVAIETTSTWESRIGRLITGAFGALLVLVALVALLAPRNSWFVFDRPVVLACTVTVLAAAYVVGRWGHRPGARWGQTHPRRTIAAGTAVSTLLCGVYTASAITGFGWDAAVLAKSATTLTDGGRLTGEQLDYFARFPNNVPFLFVELIVGKVGDLVGLPVVAALVLLQVALVALIVWCLGRTAWVLGRPGRIVPVQGAGLLLIGLSPQVGVPYTDLPGAACVAVAVTAMASAMASDTLKGGSAWAAAATASLAAGVMFKPYVAVVLIALVLVGVVVVCTARSWALARRAGVALLIGIAIVAATTTGISVAAQHGTGLTNDRLQSVRAPFPVELWLAAGTYDSADPSPTRRYGAYNQQLVDAAAAIDDPQPRRQMLREQVRDQVTGRSLADNVRFFGAKAAWVWGDATFWASGEGTDSRRTSAHDAGPLLALSVWTIAGGEHYRLRAALTQGVWIALLLVTGVGAIITPHRRLTTTWSLALIGLTAYLMLFEARPRYLLALLPILLAMTTAVRLRRHD